MTITICADDYGLDPAINAGIEALAAAGDIDAVSVMAHAGADLDGIARLVDTGVAIGLHLVLVEERARTHGAVDALLDDDGRLPADFATLFARLLTRPRLAAALVEEAAAQLLHLETALAGRARVAFVNSHQHVHLFPPIWRALHGFLDRPTWRVRAIPRPHVVVHPRSLALNAAAVTSWALAPLHSADVVVPLGIEIAGAPDVAGIRRVIAVSSTLPLELVVHPGDTDHVLRNRYAHWGYRWERERDLLQSAEVRRLLQRKAR